MTPEAPAAVEPLKRKREAHQELTLPLPNDPKEVIAYGIRSQGEPPGGFWPSTVEYQQRSVKIASGARQKTLPGANVNQRAAAQVLDATDSNGRPIMVRARTFRLLGKGMGNRVRFDDPKVARHRNPVVVEVVLWCPIRHKDPVLGTPGDHATYPGRAEEYLETPVRALREAVFESEPGEESVDGEEVDRETRLQGTCPHCVFEAEQKSNDRGVGSEFWAAYRTQIRQRAYMIRRLRDG